VFASTKARFEESYRSIAQKLALSGWNDPKTNIFQLVASWLSDESNGRWTMVLDSVDDLQVFYPSDANGRSRFYDPAVKPLATYLPQSHHGSILLTSRSRDIAARLIGGYKNIMEVHAMEPDQALQLLETKMEDSSTMAGAFDLLQTLDYIPLAISQAAAYINRRTRITIFGYIDEFNKNHKKKESILNQDAGDLRRDLSSSNSVVTTWQMSFERIRKDRPSAADLLALMSFFNPQGIPESVLRRNHHHRRDRRANSSNNGYELEDEDEDGQFDDDFDLLHAFSLVKVTAHDDMCEMHALVQFCTRVWLSSFGNVNQWRSEFLALMAREFPPGDFDNWIKCQQLLPHVELLHQDEPLTEEALKDWAQVLTNTAWYIWKKGNYRTARDVAEKAFQARSRILGPDDLSTLVTLEIFGLVMWDHGKYDEAETATRQVLQGRLKQLGQQHIDTYASINNLALVLQKQGKYDEAEQMARQAFEGRDRELASHHIDTLTSMDNLALILQKKGNLAEAEEMADRALDGRKKQLGDQHPDTLSSINNLSMILQEQGKYEKAYEMAQQALRGRESGLGRQHPDTLSSMNNVALILQKQGMYEQSRVLAQWAVEGREKELGEEHPDTLTSLGNLAKVMLNQGKYNEAEGLARRVLEGKEKRLGRQHLDVITSSHNLALVLQKQAKYDEAETMTRRALDGYEMALGMDHPNTLTSVYSLAYLLHQSRQFDLASRCYRRAYDGYASKLGPAHPRTVACLKHYRAMEREAVDARGEEKSGSGFDDSDI
jgi:tetratricopeptide (TPR) repeat protein